MTFTEIATYFVLIPFGAILFILYIIGVILHTPQGTGWAGEFVIKRRLGKTEPGKRYVIHNMIIADNEGHTSQIDHIFIHPTGIYVIETKNSTGRIYGSESDQEWTQVLHYGKKKYKMYNPIKQNATHIYRLKGIIGDSYKITSMVVFVRADIDHLKANGVYDADSMVKAIRAAERVLTPEEMQAAYDKLMEYRESHNITKSEHVVNAQKTVAKVEHNICPRCNGKLVERNGKYGKFYGCENYPRCKFTKK